MLNAVMNPISIDPFDDVIPLVGGFDLSLSRDEDMIVWKKSSYPKTQAKQRTRSVVL